MNLANRITIARMLLIPLFMLAYQPYPPWLVEKLPVLSAVNDYGAYIAALVFVIAAATDKLDGYVARTYNQVTNLGKLLDPLADKLLIAAALVLLVQRGVIPSWIAVAIIGRELLVSYIRIRAASQRVVLAADRHGKIKLVVQVVAITAALLGNFPFSFVTSFDISLAMMIAAVAVTLYSGYLYIANNMTVLQLRP
ncbi:MAG: CDP-diacylglycerol--glycerol-3-phosphate 3-phosphatidyltransferase [Paenibacillus sp.]|nr:CDP-diacylglycerol--glycerol-3-phosphate 3-phosphatidyltransferase [Paenibacillus sp.]